MLHRIFNSEFIYRYRVDAAAERTSVGVIRLSDAR